MTENYMLTIPRNENYPKRAVMEFCKNSCKKWVIGFEKGKGGYMHYQVRISTSLSFEGLKTVFPQAHIEKCTDTWEYEKKEGHYLTSEDNERTILSRFGKLRDNQERIIERVRKGGSRTITAVIDEQGNTGKSFLCRHLYERGIGYYVPPYLQSVQKIVQFVASGYKGEEIIVIDIPRSWRWSTELYTAIEAIKDGLVTDDRYFAKSRNIEGVKVLVLTNKKPKLDALSVDRWDLLNHQGYALQ